MHAIHITKPGGPEILQWAETPQPRPKDDEVLIKIAAAGLNRADILQRQGKYPPPPGAGPIPGVEASGVVESTGMKVTRWKPGDKVCALLSSGGYAEYAAAPEGQCLPLPSNLSFSEGASLPEALVTVYANIFVTAALKPGETVLVHGGSSGIGTAAIQMLKTFGAKVFVTAGSEEKCDACIKLGADLAINYKQQDFVAAIKHETAGRGVDIVLDMVGGDYLPRNLDALAQLGRHVSIATQHGVEATLDLRLVMKKRLMITGSTLRGRPAGEKARLVCEVEQKIWPGVAAGTIKSLIYKAYPIKNVAEAHKMMESGAHIGKIVLEVG